MLIIFWSVQLKLLVLFFLSLSFAYNPGPKDQLCGKIGEEIRVVSDEKNTRFMRVHDQLGYKLYDTNKYFDYEIFMGTTIYEFQREIMPELEQGEHYCFEGELYHRRNHDDELFFWVEKVL